MADEPNLAAHAREAVRSGNLPSRRPDRTFGGPGNGAACAVCDQPVRRDQMELELEFNRHGARPGLDRYIPGASRLGSSNARRSRECRPDARWR